MKQFYTDEVGPIEHQSLEKYQYFVTLLNEYSGYSMVRIITRKSEAARCVVQMITALENILNDKLKLLTLLNRNSVKWIRSDEDGVYVGHQFGMWLSQRGIIHEVATAYSPESSGSPNRLNRTLMDMARTMLESMNGINDKIWAEAINASNFIGNRLFPKSCMETKTSNEIIHGGNPNVGHCPNFGRGAFVHVPAQKRDGKFFARAYGVILSDIVKEMPTKFCCPPTVLWWRQKVCTLMKMQKEMLLRKGQNSWNLTCLTAT